MYFPDHLRLGLDFDPGRLWQDLSVAVGQGWRRHYNRDVYDGEWEIIALRAQQGARHPAAVVYANALCDAYVDLPLLEHCPGFRGVLSAFSCPLRSVRLLRLGPGTVVAEHTDGFLGIEDGLVRLHIPIVTNEAVEFRVNGTPLEMAPGSVWYVDVGAPHSVANRGSTDRVHLVIDAVLDKWLVGLFEKAEKAQDFGHSST